MPAGILGAGDREGGGALGSEDGDRARPPPWAPVPRRRPAPSTPPTPSLIQTISASGVASRKRRIDSSCALPVRQMRQRLEGAQPLQGGGRRCRLDGRRRDRRSPTSGDGAARRGPPPRPARRRWRMRSRQSWAAGEAVVDDEQERRRLPSSARRVPDRPGGREDQERGEQRAAAAAATRACAPASRCSGSRSARMLQGREVDAPRLRRRDAQQKPDRRQRRERGAGRGGRRR